MPKEKSDLVYGTLDLLHTAELPERSVSGFDRGHSRRNISGDQTVQMLANLLRHVGFMALLSKQPD